MNHEGNPFPASRWASDEYTECHHRPYHIISTLTSPLSKLSCIAMSEKVALQIALSNSLVQAPMEFSKCYKWGYVLLVLFFKHYQLCWTGLFTVMLWHLAWQEKRLFFPRLANFLEIENKLPGSMLFIYKLINPKPRPHNYLLYLAPCRAIIHQPQGWVPDN